MSPITPQRLPCGPAALILDRSTLPTHRAILGVCQEPGGVLGVGYRSQAAVFVGQQRYRMEAVVEVRSSRAAVPIDTLYPSSSRRRFSLESRRTAE